MAKVKDPETQEDNIEKGTISVHTENLFPIIKRSLYSEQEIFLRELISNAQDATSKIQHLSSLGTFTGELGELKITVEINKEAKTLTIKDRGIGMSAEEVRKYINQVAFSGAEEFAKKFKDIKDTKEIIGKFGLGFYSAFMVADTVEIITRSYKKNQGGVRWVSDGSTEYTLEKYKRTDRGTDIILHLAEDAMEYLESARINNILNKYCKFLPVPLEFEDKIINTTEPIWRKSPADLTDEDYLKFFKELYPFSEEPLFWIHLNVDFPFELTGILYFPKVRQEIEVKKDRISLYSRQVFITNSVESFVPEYLMLLQGVIDSPDIPLNVSRSYLQGDPNVKKISSYITRKVADKMKELFRDDRDKFIEKWPDIETFVKFGMLSDDKFYEKAVDFALFKNTEGEFFTTEEYKEKVSAMQKDKDENLVYLYASDKLKQDAYIQSAKGRDWDVLLMDGVLDSHFIGLMERKIEKTTWKRVDSDTLDNLIPKDETQVALLSEEQSTAAEELFKGVLPQESWTVKAEAMGQDEMPVVITRPEFMRRMKDMAAMGGGMMGMGAVPDAVNVLINTSSTLTEKIVTTEDKTEQEKLAKEVLDLAMLSQDLLTGQALTEFIKRSLSLIADA